MATEAKIRLSLDGVQSVVGGLSQVGDKMGDVNVAARSLQAVAGGLTFAALAATARAAINSLAELDGMSQKTGASVENLSRLQKVAQMVGQDFGTVDAAISKLAKGMATVDDQGNKTNAALRAIGVSSKDTAGKLRDPSQVLIDVAKKLQGYQDGAAKTALINDLLGKSGADLLPYLNNVANSVDQFTGASKKSTVSATEFNDKLGMMKVRAGEVGERVASAMLPTLNDFLDVLADTTDQSTRLMEDDAIASWTDSSVLGLARLIDVMKTLPGLARAIGGSFEVVWADLKLLSAAGANLSPTAQLASIARGSDPWKDFKAALDERNEILAHANERYHRLWNEPANTMEKAILARIDQRTGANLDARDLQLRRIAESAKAASNEEKGVLNYTSGGNAGEKKLTDYQKLMQAISGKIALSQRELDLARPLTESEKQLASVMADRASGKIKLTDVEMAGITTEIDKLSVLERVIERNKVLEQQEKAALERAQKQIVAAYESLGKLQEEVDNYGKLPSQISAATAAKLRMHQATLEANEGTDEEIARVEALIAVQEKMTGLYARKEYLDQQKKTAEESLKIWENFRDNMQRNVGDTLYEIMEGRFDSIGDAWQAMVKRMLADAMAADLASALFNKGKGGNLAGLFGNIGDLFGGLFGGPSVADFDLLGVGLPLLNAKGGVYASSSLSAYSNKIVSKPTMFAFARGAGLMGEAGPEAIMPLTRAANGSLGVRAVDAGDRGAVWTGDIIQHIHVDSRSDQASVVQAMLRAKDLAKAEIQREIKSGSRAYSRG